MPGSINRIHYVITSPQWKCEWIVKSPTHIQRSCVINHNSIDLDPMDDSHLPIISTILPALFDDVEKTVKEWIQSGDTNAHLLLQDINIPSYLAYAESVLGKKFNIN